MPEFRPLDKSPQEGGCWFCYSDAGEMAFSSEFDCWVHVPSIQAALLEDPDNPEARIMARELAGCLMNEEQTNT